MITLSRQAPLAALLLVSLPSSCPPTALQNHAHSPYRGMPAARTAALVTDPATLSPTAATWPAHARLRARRVDRTAVDVDAELVISPWPRQSRQGRTYQALRFYGSLYQYALLPFVGDKPHSVQMMATPFPSARAAARAFDADTAEIANLYDCRVSAVASMPIPSATCAFGSDSTSVFVLAWTGNVEFITYTFMQQPLAAFIGRARAEAVGLARGEAVHVRRLVSAHR